LFGHLKHADFIRRAKTIFHRAQDPEMMAALALEIQDRIHHVFQHAGAGDGAFLGDVANQE